LAIVGDGPERERVEDELARYSLDRRVRLLGERGDVPELLADADVFLLASRSEGLPLSVIEAMAAGLPVVASDVGGLRELVRDGETGTLVPPGDPAALANALRPLVADRELRRCFGSAGRERAKGLFDLSGFRRAHLELYRRELAAAGVSPAAPKRERR
jgi:glycosyltransferase involved in cell wall biosynthesis